MRRNYKLICLKVQNVSLENPFINYVDQLCLAEIAKIQGIENRSGSPVYTIYRRKSERIKAPGTVGQPTGIHSPKVIWGEDIGTVKEWIKTKVLNDVYPELVIAPVRNSKEAYDIKEENATEVPDDAPVNEIKTIVIFY